MSTTAAVVLSACGGGGGDAAPSAASCVGADEVAADITVDPGTAAVALVARDDRFDPPCIALPAAGPVTIVVRNEGAHPHNLQIGTDLVGVDAAQVGIVEVEVGPEGATFVCTLHSGMDGELRVRA